MFLFFKNFKSESGIKANVIVGENDMIVVGVRNQTCPEYLLAINKAIENYPIGTRFKLQITRCSSLIAVKKL